MKYTVTIGQHKCEYEGTLEEITQLIHCIKENTIVVSDKNDS